MWGCTLARRLAEAGRKVLVQKSQVAGLSQTVTLPEQVSCNFEYGGMTRTLSGGRNVFHVKQM